VPFPQLFAKGKSLKSEGIGMPRDKNKGLHGLLGCNWAMPNQYSIVSINLLWIHLAFEWVNCLMTAMFSLMELELSYISQWADQVELGPAHIIDVRLIHKFGNQSLNAFGFGPTRIRSD
jgi:hypothetical protein